MYFESLLHNLIWVNKRCSKMEKHLEQDWCIPYWWQSIFLVAKNIIILRLLIHFFHIDHNAPCSPSEILPNHCTQEKLETMVMKILGINKAYYGLCENGEYKAFVVPCRHYGMLSLFPGVSFIGRGNCLFSLKCL